MKKTILVIMMLLILIVLISTATAFPILIYDKGINTSLVKSVVYSLNKDYYKTVKSIYFKKTKYVYNKWDNSYHTKNRGMGKVRIYKTGSRIYMYQSDLRSYKELKKILRHELNHQYLYYLNDSRWDNENWCKNWELR